MTIIGLAANDQSLSVVSKPKLASGDQNSVMVQIDFDSVWDDYAKSAVFFTDKERKNVFEVVLVNGECVIPFEVLEESGLLYIGVRGVNASEDKVKTSTLVKYKIVDGAPEGKGASVPPTANVYQQLLAAYGKQEDLLMIEKAERKAADSAETSERKTEIAVERARIDELVVRDFPDNGIEMVEWTGTVEANSLYRKEIFFETAFETVPNVFASVEIPEDRAGYFFDDGVKFGWAISKVSKTSFVFFVRNGCAAETEFKVKAFATVDGAYKDAELKDLRIGADGITYESAGTAVRTLLNENKSFVETLISEPEFDFGYRWIDESGNVHEDANYAVTRIVDLSDCKAIKFRLYQYNNDSTNTHLGMIAYYDQNLTHIESITEIIEENGIVEATLIPPENAKYAIASLYKPIGNGYVQFHYDVDSLKNVDSAEKVIDLCEFPINRGYIGTSGNIVADENWVYSDYIPVKAGKTLELSMHGHNAVNSVSYYNGEKTLIGGVVADIEYIIGTTEKFKYGIEMIPEGTEFIRLCYRIGASTVSKCKYVVNVADAFEKMKQHDSDIEKLYSGLNAVGQNVEKALAGKTVFLAGDSRSSTDYSFYGEAMQEKTGASVIVGGASGWSTGKIATNKYFERLSANPHDFSIWLVGGNDTGASGTVGTFDSNSVNGLNGEKLVSETDVFGDYNGTTFIQAVDHIMRKYKALFYDWKTLANGLKPKMIFCTDIPQKRSGGGLTWSLPSNWERKRNAIIECCKKNNVACLDLYELCNFDMEYEPEWTSPTDMVNNNGLYFMDGLHPNKYGVDIITSLEIEEIKKYLTIY